MQTSICRKVVNNIYLLVNQQCHHRRVGTASFLHRNFRIAESGEPGSHPSHLTSAILIHDLLSEYTSDGVVSSRAFRLCSGIRVAFVWLASKGKVR